MIFFSLFLLSQDVAATKVQSFLTPAGPGPEEVEYPEVSEDQRVSITTSLQNKDHVQICAHRGYWKDAPENSVKAVTLAIENQMNVMKFETCRTSKDGEMVLRAQCHNADELR